MTNFKSKTHIPFLAAIVSPKTKALEDRACPWLWGLDICLSLIAKWPKASRLETHLRGLVMTFVETRISSQYSLSSRAFDRITRCSSAWTFRALGTTLSFYGPGKMPIISAFSLITGATTSSIGGALTGCSGTTPPPTSITIGKLSQHVCNIITWPKNIGP